ncbi:SPOR domain-containing protein [Marinospirillum insulare]|uniref:SPOR domain-containing protein n=1 Tax=Marinospirillum insulare TaxID=217169 RepID=A0ABQ5ZUI7_9GAMM|nr:SPOR domain-containing protein [Marinospirillum insulare]GLR62948.1 hypothetical protein GCM10007878_03830 [Marinospirillum insulare]
MARDFASRQRKRSKPDKTETAKSRGASPRATEDDLAELSVWDRLPAWGWLTLGLVAGFLIAILSQPSSQTPLQEKPPLVAAEVEKTPEAKEEKPKKEPVKAKGQAAPRFDFYTLLPESEVVAPEIEAYKSTPREAKDQPRFMLQVGSFRSTEDAKRQEQRLKSLGYDRIRISEVETGNGDIWHRVQVGPYQNRRLLASVQNNLAKAGLDFMLLKLRDEPEVEQSTAPQSITPN